jgi:hypothetical protein
MPGARRRCHLLCALLAGCLGAPRIEPVPFAGPAPRAIAVWPWTGTTAGAEPFADRGTSLLTGLDRAVAARGYRVQASAVVRELLASAAPPPPTAAPWAAVGQELAVDAVLQVDVRRCSSEVSRTGRLQRAAWDLQWRLLATADGAVLWQHEHHGAWRRADLEPDPAYQRDDLPDPSPFGQAPPSFSDLGELLQHLHWQALQHLPAAPVRTSATS